MSDEGVHVREFLDLLVGRLAGAVAGARFDTDQVRRAVGIGMLHRRNIFEAVPRHDSVVGVGGRRQDRRVTHPVANVVIGRIGPQHPEIRLPVRIAVIVDPVAPGGEPVEAQHVHHADSGQRRCEQVGPLIHHRADEQAAIGPPLDCETVSRCDVLGDQIFAGRDEIVEHVLLVRPPAGIVPGLAIFAAAADVRDREDAAHVDPGQPARLEGGRGGDIEPAISVEQGRVRPAAIEIAPAHEEHRDPRPVLRIVEDLRDFVIARIIGKRRLGEHGALPGRAVIAIDRPRPVVAGEGVEGLARSRMPAKAAGAADPGQRDMARRAAIEAERPHLALCVDEIFEHQSIADDRRAFERRFILRHQLARRRCRACDVGDDDPLARRILVGPPVEERAAIAEIVPVILHASHQRARRRIGAGEIDQGDRIARVRPFGRSHDQPASVIRHLGAVVPARMIGGREDQPVLGLGSAEPMEIDRLVLVQLLKGMRAGLRKARIEEARSVLRPVEIGEFDPADLVARRLPGRHVEHAHRAPVGAAVLDRIEEMAPVLRGPPFGERRRAVLRPAVGIDQHARRAIKAVTHIEYRLVLKPVVARIEIAASSPLRDAEPFVIVDLGHPRPDRLAAGQRLEEGVGDRILGRHPFPHLGIGAHVIFEPAIGIGDALPEMLLHHIAPLRLGIMDRRPLRGRERREEKGGQDEKESGPAHEKAPGCIWIGGGSSKARGAVKAGRPIWQGEP